MKKSVLVIAMAFGFTVTSLNASPQIQTSNNLEIIAAKVSVSPFCTSIAKGDIETVRKLITLGADVNKMSNGMTPAMYAAKYNRVKILKLLVSHGADLNKKSDNGLTAKKYAEASNATQALELIEHVSSKKKNRRV